MARPDGVADKGVGGSSQGADRNQQNDVDATHDVGDGQIALAEPLYSHEKHKPGTHGKEILEHGKNRDAEYAPQQAEIERPEAVEAIQTDRNGKPCIDQVEKNGHGFGDDRGDGGALDAQPGKSAVAENEQVIERHIGYGHKDGIQRQHFGTGDPDKEGPEHHAHEREKEAEDAPVQEFFGGIQQGIRRDQDPKYIGSEETGKNKQGGCHDKEKKYALNHNRAYFVVAFLAVAPGDDDLRAGTETESNGEGADVVEPAHGGCAQFDFADTAQKSGIGDVDDILRQQAEQNGVAYLADLLIGVHTSCFYYIGFQKRKKGSFSTGVRFLYLSGRAKKDAASEKRKKEIPA